MGSENIESALTLGRVEPPISPAPLAPVPGTISDESNQSVGKVSSYFPHTPAGAKDRIVKTAAAKRIVVVDDERDQVDLTVILLEAAGHTAYGTTDGRAALELVLLHGADLLLIDFMMPKMGGGVVCKAVRAHPSGAQTKIVMISGTPEDTVRAEFGEYEAFLQKPVDPDRLLKAVEDL